MAVLDNTQREAVYREFMQNLSDARVPINVVRSVLRGAADDIDTYLDGEAARINAALAPAARNGLTTKQKYHLLSMVALKRAQEL